MYKLKFLPCAMALFFMFPATAQEQRSGIGPTTSNNEIGAASTTQQYERWLSNGFESYFGVGKTELLMMKTNILPRSPGVVLRWLSSMSPLPRKGCEHFVDTKWKDCGGPSTKFKHLLDRLTQMSDFNS